MLKILMIALGGAAGAVARYLISGWGQRLVDGAFPAGTLIVNVVGCLLIGFLARAFDTVVLIREEYRLALLVGLLGGLTTFSSYGWETFAMLNDGQRWAPLGNFLLNNALGLFAVWAGFRLAERLYGG